jgi:hypothetical protein
MKGDKAMLLRFSDGIDIDTSGPLRPLHLWDGWYVVGEGMLLPVESLQEARDEIAAMKVINEGREPLQMK